eukprot:COSAG03_NODE_941_length_5251_cov_254.015334_6_plen_32_part_00
MRVKKTESLFNAINKKISEQMPIHVALIVSM